MTDPREPFDRDALYRWIINSATDFAIMATDRTGRAIAWSASAERILGWTAAEMLDVGFPKLGPTMPGSGVS